MNCLYFNVDHGYLEGIIRGYKDSLITNSNYSNLTQCHSLEDLKLQLGTTDYASLLNDLTNISTSSLSEAFNKKMLTEFEYIYSQSSGNLKKFLDFFKQAFMIDNVILLITGTLHERDTHELLKKCHPLGTFEGMPALCVASNTQELYSTVLIDTPLSGYFEKCLSAQDLDELNIEIIRNTLYKSYVEEFYEFCKTNCDDITFELMKNILDFEADRRTLSISVNSINTELSKDQRYKLFPKLGKLYPEGQAKLAKIDEADQAKQVCDKILEYKNFFENNTSSSFDENSNELALEDKFFEYEAKLHRESFEQQFHFAQFYSYFKLKEQEIRNVVWIAECIAQEQLNRVNNYIPLFD